MSASSRVPHTSRLGPAIVASVFAAVLAFALGGVATAKIIGTDESSAGVKPADRGEPGSRADMKAVFASLDEGCREADPNPITAEDSAFNCDHGSYLIRYAHWRSQIAAEEYLAENYGGIHGTEAQWFVVKSFAGSVWRANAPNKDPDLPYVWAAIYQDYPYTVTVKAADEETRERARTSVTPAFPNDVETN
jgi:hypothetical protein